MNAHTPGKWEIRSRHESSMDHTTVTRYLAIPGHDYIPISRIVDPTPEQDETARANVRLLAVAPELLEALKELLASQLTLMPPFKAGKDAQDAWADRRAKARNDAAIAIAKAEGA